MKTCYIFGAMPINCKLPKFHETDLIIAADLGYKNLIEQNITPDIIVGDFDSLNYVPKGDNVLIHPAEKDETDTLLAVNEGFKKGYTYFYLYGCLGGRLDHTLANIQLAEYIAEKGAKVIIKDKEADVTVIKNNRIKFTNSPEGTFSVFSLSDISKHVTIENAKYSVKNIELKSSFPLGVSNEFIKKDTLIDVENGILCIVYNNKNSFIIG